MACTAGRAQLFLRSPNLRQFISATNTERRFSTQRSLSSSATSLTRARGFLRFFFGSLLVDRFIAEPSCVYRASESLPLRQCVGPIIAKVTYLSFVIGEAFLCAPPRGIVVTDFPLIAGLALFAA